MKKVTVKELREQAKVAGIKGYSRMRKAELEDKLRELEAISCAKPLNPDKEVEGKKEYIEVLSSVDLGTAVNYRVKKYKEVYEKIKRLDSWHPETEAEANILLGFKARNEHSESFGVYICNDLNEVEIRNREEAQKLFLELLREQFREVYGYAYTEILKGKTVREIREAAEAEGIKLPIRLRKRELIEEIELQLKRKPAEKPRDEVFADYEEVRQAYKDYERAQGEYYEASRPSDEKLKEKADRAYKRYREFLSSYMRGEMSERVSALKWVRKRCEEAALPVERLSGHSLDWLIELSHKCGIHASRYQGMSPRDMAIRLLREAGVETGAETFYEKAQRKRKLMRKELRGMWQKRHAIKKAQVIFGESSAEYEALREMWEKYQEEIDKQLREYKQLNEYIKQHKDEEDILESRVKKELSA